MSSVVNKPAHYVEGRQIEPIDVIEDWGLDYVLGNALKYISRAGRKGDMREDLEKARWYLTRKLDQLKDDANAAKISYQPDTQKVVIDGEELTIVALADPRVSAASLDTCTCQFCEERRK